MPVVAGQMRGAAIHGAKQEHHVIGIHGVARQAPRERTRRPRQDVKKAELASGIKS